MTMSEKVSITRESLEMVLTECPNVTRKELAVLFGCSPTTIGRRLKSYHIRTKPWSERRHSEATKRKISQVRVEMGFARGDRNPNFGDKKRPWLEGDSHPFRVWHRENPDFGERQRGAENPIHKVRHLYQDKSYVAHITRGIRAHTDKKKGSSYEEVYGPQKAAEYREKLRQASPGRLAKTLRQETRPERILRQHLKDLEVVFTSQVPIGPYTVDFFVEAAGLVVQADGDYWHANPIKFKELSATQRKQRRLDASCNSFLRNRGYSVLRLWECDLYADPEGCRFRLEDALEKK